MTQNNQNIGTLTAADVLLQYSDVIAKAARRSVAKVHYDLSMSGEELQMDAQSEAKIAVVNGLHLYDSALSSLETFIYMKVFWHFKELQRQNARHSEREISWSILEKRYADRGGEKVDFPHYIGGDKAIEMWEDLQRQQEVESALKAMLRFAVSDQQAVCLHSYLEAMENDEPNPVPHVAKVMGCSRQHVYDVIDSVIDVLPKELADEIRNLF